MKMFNGPITIKCRPAAAGLVYRTALTNAYGAKWGVWLDEINTDVPHYCLKWGVDGINTGHNFVYQIQTTFYVSFRGLK